MCCLAEEQRAFEMLLKAALVQTGEKSIFDKQTGRSIGFQKCLNLAATNSVIQLAEADAGTLRAIDAMRDDEQHWYNVVSEQVLYLHARAGVTLFDDLLQRVFSECLATYLPHRVLPLSVDPPNDLALILDEEYSQISSLLQPGRRAGHEARARIRTLLALEAHIEPDTRVSNKDVARVEKGIRAGASRDQVFPRLDEVSTAIDGAGISLTVHFTKKQGAAVRFVGDDSVRAAAVREVDLQRKYHRSPSQLATSVGLTTNRASALRRHLGIDDDESCTHVFVLGSQRHPHSSRTTPTERCGTPWRRWTWTRYGRRIDPSGTIKASLDVPFQDVVRPHEWRRRLVRAHCVVPGPDQMGQRDGIVDRACLSSSSVSSRSTMSPAR
jgi:hypothetical protein